MSDKQPLSLRSVCVEGWHARCDLCGLVDHFFYLDIRHALAAIAAAGWIVPADISAHEYFCPECSKSRKPK